MLDQYRKKRQTIMVELQHYDRQGISILLNEDSEAAKEISDVLQVREEISYLEKRES